MEELFPSFIVLLFELTAKARRIGGDVEFVNLTPAAAIDIEQFRCPDFLSFGNDENQVITEFRQFIENELPEKNMSNGLKTESLQIQSRVDEIYKISDRVIEIADEMGFEQSELSKIKIAVYEGCLNAIEHAYHSDPHNYVNVDIEYSDDNFKVSIIDFGEGFQVGENGSFDVIKAAMERTRGGMGLHIIKRSMDDVRYEKDALNGNRLVLTKYLNNEPQKKMRQ